MENNVCKTILLVEDEAVISILTSKTLQSFGYKVLTVNSGEKAVKLASTDDSINLILMDIDLGKGMDGTEAARQILEMRNIPIVFHTSHSEREMVEKVKGITRYGYIIKSLGNFVLQSSIEMAFELFEANRINEESINALRESEEKYRAAFMTSPDSVNINAMDGRYVDINNGFTQLTGFTREDVIGILSSEIKIWHIPEDRVKLIKGLSETGYVENLESVFRRKDGSLTTALMSARVIKIKNEPHILSVTRDISERKQYEEQIKLKNEELEATNEELNATMEELEAMNEELIATNNELQKKEKDIRNEQNFTNSLINSLPGIFYLYPYPELRLKRWNSNYKDLLGLSVEKLRDLPLMDIHPPEAEKEILQAIESVMETGHSIIEIPVINKDGLPVQYLMTGVRFESENRIYLLGVGIDVDEQKKIDDALKENMYLVERILWSTPNLIYIYDINHNENVYSNRLVTDFLGYTAEQIKSFGSKLFKNIVHPDDEGKIRLHHEKFQNIEENTVLEVEYRMKHADGNWHWLKSRDVMFIRDKKNSVLQILGFSEDITARKESDEKIVSLLREKEMLLNEVHHRIKNYMNTIHGLIAIQVEISKEPSVISVLDSTATRVRNMMDLYNKLYRVADINNISVAGYLPPLIDEIIENLPLHIPVKTIKKIDDFVLEVKTLQTMGIIINELLTNSMKHAFRKNSEAVITVSLTREENRATLLVQDNGVNINDADNFKNPDGFGLQLVGMLAEQIGGGFRIEKDNGTRVSIDFNL